MNVWSTESDGTVLVNGIAPTLPKILPDLRRILANYGALIAKHSARTGVPESWIASFIKSESNGDAAAVGSSGEVGLMQLMPFHWGGRTAEQMKSPDQNIATGSDILYRLSRSPCIGWDLPKACSGYNCGQTKEGCPKPRATSIWGMCVAADYYITNIAAQNNDLIKILGVKGTPTAPPPAPNKTFIPPIASRTTPDGNSGLLAVGVGAAIGLALLLKK